MWVLGGGGVAGIAWETGILTGLAEHGVVIDPSDVVIGTSAGAVVGAQATSGLSADELFERQYSSRPREVSPPFTSSVLWRLATAPAFARTPEAAARAVGRKALAAAIPDPELLLRIIADRLPSHEWPSHDLRITAVDAESGELRVFTATDGVPLVDAVAASCCIPFLFSPVSVDGRRYLDGGIRSPLNLDLAPGSGAVIALAPTTASLARWARTSRQASALGARTVVVVTRDRESRRVQGGRLMDRSILPALVTAGRAQGRALGPRLRSTLALGA